MTVILTRGLPASGKSTWARRTVEESDGTVIRVNMDEIRAMLNLPFSKDAEDLALKIQDQAILAGVKAGKHVIVDNTHIEKKMPTRYKKLFDGDVQFMLKDFTFVDAQECISRDFERTYGRVGPEVIKRMAARLPKVEITEAWLNDVKLSDLYVPNPFADIALIVDIDGTLAEHVARSPYDYSRVLTDAIIPSVAKLVDTYFEMGYRILITSGRPDIDNVRRDTQQWLHNHGIGYDQLFMRPANMLKENDADVKQYLFDEYIRDRYAVSFVLDDRDRVVRRWRKLGLKVLQVAEGDF